MGANSFSVGWDLFWIRISLVLRSSYRGGTLMITGLPNHIPKEVIDQLIHNMLVHLVREAGGYMEFTVDAMDNAVEQIILESDAVKQIFTIRLKGESH